MSVKRVTTLAATIPILFVSLTAIAATLYTAGPPSPTGDDLASVSISIREPAGMFHVVAIPAAETNLDPQTVVVGIQVDGLYRAYLVDILTSDSDCSAMFDEIEGHSIIVSYSEPQDRIDLRCWNGHSGEIECPFEVTTWNAWEQAHPETHVCSVSKKTEQQQP